LLAILVTLAALVLVAVRAVGGGDARHADVVLSEVRDATVLDDGARRPAREGEVLPRDAAVETGNDGQAVLTVLRRRVVLGPRTVVVVPNGAEMSLARGSLLVDRRRGPGLALRADQVTVDQISRGALAVDRSFSVRVRVLIGAARVTSSAGRRVGVPALEQVQAKQAVLPTTAAPLVLAHDAWERATIPQILQADDVLTAFARDIDGRLGPARTAAVPAAYRVNGSAPEGGASELVLPVAIGRAATVDGSGAQRIARARALRADGGSWGVVAGLMRASVADVVPGFSDVLVEPTPSTPSGGASGTPGTPGGGPSGGGGPTPTGPGASSSSTPGPAPSSTQPSSPGPTTTSPTPSDSVDELVDTVKSALPVPLPTPSLLLLDLPLVRATLGPVHL
jgi:hypothetical protein